MSQTSIVMEKDPIVRRAYSSFYLALVLLCVFIVISTTLTISLLNATIGDYFVHLLPPIFWILVFYGVVYVFLTFTDIRHWRRIARLREAAIQNNQRFLASPQPTPDAHAISIPVILKIRVSPAYFALVFLAPLFAVIVGLVASEGFGNREFLSDAVTALFIGWLYFGFMAFLAIRHVHQDIEVTEDGLTTYYMGNINSIRWRDARLFTSYPINYLTGRSRVVELSDEHTIVRWRWPAQPGIKKLWRFEPRMSFEEYSQFIEHLHQFITAKTDLPFMYLTDRRVRR